MLLDLSKILSNFGNYFFPLTIWKKFFEELILSSPFIGFFHFILQKKTLKNWNYFVIICQ